MTHPREASEENSNKGYKLELEKRMQNTGDAFHTTRDHFLYHHACLCHMWVAGAARSLVYFMPCGPQ